MGPRFPIAAAMALFFAVPLFAQRPEDHHDGPRANQGHVPQAPAKREVRAEPEIERDDSRVNSIPHVNNDHWYGHDRPDDKRYVIAHPFEHGRFERIGPSFRFRVDRFDRDRHRIWLPGGFGFEVASWDWALAANWCWDCGDDFIVYDDPDHFGWYLLYDIHTGAYIHVQYIGA